MSEEFNKRLTVLENKVSDMDKFSAVQNALFIRMSKTLDSLEESVPSLQTTMMMIQNEIKLHTERIEKSEKKVEIIENKSRIDWIELVKNSVLSIGGGGGLVYLILEVFGKIK